MDSLFKRHNADIGMAHKLSPKEEAAAAPKEAVKDMQDLGIESKNKI